MALKDSARHSDIGAGARERPVAVIDIGSNSVRLVVYSGMTRAPIPLHNEKVICALGKGLEKTGCLNAASVGMALETVERFVALAKSLGAERIDTMGTAAMRDAVNGAEFAQAIQKRCKVEVQILSGKQEARCSALGVLCGIPDAEGVIADLGGGSLELVQVSGGTMSEHTTLPLGLLRLDEASDGDQGRALSIINKALEKHQWMSKGKDRTLYAVGGAWRSLARVCIAQMDYPLHVLDNFTLERQKAISLFDVVARLGSKSLEQIKGVSRARLATLPLAAAVLERILEINEPRELVFSIYGMREGQFFSALPESTRKQDPLISLAEEIGRSAGRDPEVGRETFDWMAPLIENESPQQKRLHLTACLLRDVWWTEHPDYRAEQAFLRVLRWPFLGLCHEDRAALALALYYRYSTTPTERIVVQAHALLDEAHIRQVKTIGLTLRLAYALSAGGPRVLRKTSIHAANGKLVLKLPQSDPLFATGPYPRRLKRLADHLGLEDSVQWM